MSDIVEILRHSLIQHGSLNNRIYLMSLDKRDHPMIFSLLDKIAKKINTRKSLRRFLNGLLMKQSRMDMLSKR